MAKHRQTEDAAADGVDQSGGESISRYFRRVFGENPRWLQTRSNAKVLEQWLADHPEETEVPKRVKQNLSNVKSLLRKDLRKKPGRPKKETMAAELVVESQENGVHVLEPLEELIDECLMLAKSLDRDGLSSVIRLLKRARNEVVWIVGE